jgi:hypothetical protein
MTALFNARPTLKARNLLGMSHNHKSDTRYPLAILNSYEPPPCISSVLQPNTTAGQHPPRKRHARRADYPGVWPRMRCAQGAYASLAYEYDRFGQSGRCGASLKQDIAARRNQAKCLRPLQAWTSHLSRPIVVICALGRPCDKIAATRSSLRPGSSMSRVRWVASALRQIDPDAKKQGRVRRRGDVGRRGDPWHCSDNMRAGAISGWVLRLLQRPLEVGSRAGLVFSRHMGSRSTGLGAVYAASRSGWACKCLKWTA